MSNTKASANGAFPSAPWTAPLHKNADPCGPAFPQAIAHRGYKAAWPENSLEAMHAAVEAGAHALETDVHLSKDGVVVLSHDPSLKRCFGVERRIADCEWEYLSTLKTLRAPHLGMPRFVDLLEWLCEPGVRHVWVLLDIKINDAADDLLPAIAAAFASVKSPIPWENRFMLGCWNATYTTKTSTHLPAFSKTHISFSPHYTAHFLARQPRMGVNMFQRSLAGSSAGARFVRRVGDEGRPLFLWTVNDERWMRRCLRANESGEAQVHGVISDDPALFLDVCRRWGDEEKKVRSKEEPLGWSEWILVWLGLLAVHVFRVGLYWVRRFKGQYDFLDEVSM